MWKLREEEKKINRGKVAHNFCYEDDFKERSEWKKESTKLKNQRERERDPREGPRVLMSLRLDFEPMG